MNYLLTKRILNDEMIKTNIIEKSISDFAHLFGAYILLSAMHSDLCFIVNLQIYVS